MPYLYLFISVFLSASSSILCSIFNRKNLGINATALYNLLMCLGTLIGWGIMSVISFNFHKTTLWFSVAFGAIYFFTNMATILALKNGPVALTSLFSQLSLIGTTVWGFIFWGEKINITVIIGLVIAVISLSLCLYRKSDGQRLQASGKWLFFVSVVFLGNFACTVIQKTHIRTYGEAYGNMLMLFAMLTVLALCIFHFIFSNKNCLKTINKKSTLIPIFAGLCNAGLNLLLIVLAVQLPSGAVYPVVSVGGLAVNICASIFLFKEKLNTVQWLGITLGVIAVILLTL